MDVGCGNIDIIGPKYNISMGLIINLHIPFCVTISWGQKIMCIREGIQTCKTINLFVRLSKDQFFS